MREIKFRAWNGDTDKWCEVNGKTTFTLYDITRLQADEFNPFEWQYVDIQQYAGLKDKNGKEIYEGDVVRDVGTSDLVFAVKWDNNRCGYLMPDEFDPDYATYMSITELEVIGNIYENPELLT